MNLPELYYHRLIEDARVVELRHFHGGRVESGLFDRTDMLMAAIAERSADGTIYTTLNRPVSTSAPNRFGCRALKDADIDMACRLVFDFDPDRPRGTASTDAELAAAIAARDRFVRMLSARGWPMPALAMSGNGAHALYRVRIVADDQWKLAMRVIYQGALSRLGDLGGVSFDTSVRNPARIWRAYGTVNRKGAETAERPHRRAVVTLPAGAWQVVPAKLIERLYADWRPPERTRQTKVVPIHRGHGDYRTLDVVGWFRSHDYYRRDLGAGKHAVRCPWDHQHSTEDGPMSTAAVVWEAGPGWPQFHCSHAHCDGRTIRDVLALWRDADAFCGANWEGRRHG